MPWKRLLACITGSVDQELLARNGYLVTENKILRGQIRGRLRLNDGERKTLAVIGKQLGRQALQEVASIVKPETILAWHRRLVAKKFDGSESRNDPGRPPITVEVEELILETLKAAGLKIVKLPAHSPNLNSHAERFVLSVKTECLWGIILFGEASLRHALSNHVAHYHAERPHHGKGNVILFPEKSANAARDGPVQCRERLGGLLSFYYRGVG